LIALLHQRFGRQKRAVKEFVSAEKRAVRQSLTEL